MAIESVHPYLTFNGEAAEAMRLYEQALGATVEEVSRIPQAPALILHARLRLGSQVVMISDTTPERPVPRESNTMVMVEFARPEEVDQAYASMREGATILMELGDAFWGARFGMLRDRYGIGWMLSCMAKQGAQ